MKVAVVGSGVSGLAATWLLNEYSDHEVHLYEADDRPGGHAHTVRFCLPGQDLKEGVDADTGFLVLNPSTYPNFLRFLRLHPRIKIVPTEMTFSVSRDQGQFEWAGNNLAAVFCQPSRLLDPKMWRLLYDVMRFNACARRLIMGWNKNIGDNELSIGEYLDREGFSQNFRDDYLIPMTAAIWSTPPDTCAMDFPARTLLQFLSNHHLLQITGKPKWLTIQGGSIKYVDTIVSKLPPGCVHLSTPIESLTSDEGTGKVQLTTADGSRHSYDHVILACHSDTSLSILRSGGGPTDLEETILGRVRWNKNVAVLHSDTKLMPKSRLAWSCWNYLTTSVLGPDGKRKPNVDQVALTYSINHLQHIPEKRYGPVLVTLNPPMEPDEDKVVGRYNYDHPVIDAQTIRSQLEMPSIQGRRGVSYAGAWLNYGFHEDGFASGLRAVVNHIPDVHPPFEIHEPDREPQAVWIAPIFDILEGTGARVVAAAVLSWWLGIVRGVLGMFLDLRHI